MSEKKDYLYKSAFNETVDAIVITDGSTGKIIDANNSCCEMLGYEKTELIGEQLIKLFDDTTAEDLKNSPQDKSMFGSVIPNRLLKTIEGELIPVDMTINTFASESTNYVMTTLRDVRERLKHEKEILKMNKELKELNASKDKLFSIIAHDLRNPLMALMGLSEFLTEEPGEIPKEEISELAGSINKLSKDTYELLENLLSWAQVQTNRMSIDKKPFNLFNSVSRVMDVLKPSAGLKKVNLISTIPSDFIINADENMIKTTIRNLVSNSIKFSRENSSITVRALDTDNFYTIMVEDQGIGMDEECVSNLFRIDIQTSRPGTDKEKGTGLGLLICHEFVKLHGGAIKVKSEVDRGSMFIITIPVSD